jgi:hypothetical protein
MTQKGGCSLDCGGWMRCALPILHWPSTRHSNNGLAPALRLSFPPFFGSEFVLHPVPPLSSDKSRLWPRRNPETLTDILLRARLGYISKAAFSLPLPRNP